MNIVPQTALDYVRMSPNIYPDTPLCVSSLQSRGYGTAVARQVAPYVDCLNRNTGTVEKLQEACSDARLKASQFRSSDFQRVKVQRAIRWLDHVIQWRARCEARVTVEP